MKRELHIIFILVCLKQQITSKVIDIVSTIGKIEKQIRMRIESTPHKRMTPPSIQNLKTLGLWVFFLIYCSTFSFILNVGLRLTLGYLKSTILILLLIKNNTNIILDCSYS